MTASYHPRETLEHWLDQFTRLGYPKVKDLRVIDRYEDDRSETGLVVFAFEGVATTVYVSPRIDGDLRWFATFEAREEVDDLSAVELAAFAHEVTTASALVAFLEAKSDPS